ncbi:MAG: hypothetical protein AABY18_01845 [Candidatus Thermoplasmatota archaeon]
MRGPLALAVAVLVSGCLFGDGFEPTPCKPAGKATYGTLRVQLPTLADAFDHAIPTEGKCVALQQGDRVLATARIGADGNATLNLPVDGEVYITWTHPRASDTACAYHGYAFVTIPGPANVTLDVGGLCH